MYKDQSVVNARKSRSSSVVSGSTPSSSKQDELPPEMFLAIESQLPLLLTVTKSSLKLFTDLLTAYTKKEGPDETRGDEVDCPINPETLEAVFIIKNEVYIYTD